MFERIRECFLEAAESESPIPEAASKALWMSIYDTPFPEDFSKAMDELSQSISRQLVEDGLRRLLLDVCQETHQRGENLLQPKCRRLLDIALWLAGKKLLEPGLPCTLVEDLVEVCASSGEFEDVFNWIDAEKSVLKQSHIFQRGKLILLRSFNKVLKQISGSSNADLAGRILLCMAYLWPLIERSAVNHVGTHDPRHEIKISLKEEGDAVYDSRGIPINREFYVKFWKLLQDFKGSACPSAKLTSICRDVKSVIGFIKKQPLKYPTMGGGLGVGGPHSLQYNTDPNVFRLQLQDAGFRCHFLLECLVYLHRVDSPGKFADSFPPEVLKEVTSVQNELMRCLVNTGSEGHGVCKLFVDQLKREEQWVQWKSGGCKDWTKTSSSGAEPSETICQDEKAEDLDWISRKKTRKVKRYCQSQTEDSYMIGKGGEFSTSVEGIAEAYSYPNAREFVQPLLDDDLPTSLNASDKATYCWRVYRLMASEHHFSMDAAAPLDIRRFVAQGFPEISGMEMNGGKEQTPIASQSAQTSKGTKRKERVTGDKDVDIEKGSPSKKPWLQDPKATKTEELNHKNPSEGAASPDIVIIRKDRHS